jgi:hypothetical protein
MKERGEAFLGFRGCPLYRRTPTEADRVGRCNYVYNTSYVKLIASKAILSPRAEITKFLVNIKSVAPFLTELAHFANAVHPV